LSCGSVQGCRTRSFSPMATNEPGTRASWTICEGLRKTFAAWFMMFLILRNRDSWSRSFQGDLEQRPVKTLPGWFWIEEMILIFHDIRSSTFSVVWSSSVWQALHRSWMFSAWAAETFTVLRRSVPSRIWRHSSRTETQESLLRTRLSI